MIDRGAMQDAVEQYDPKKLELACVASHSGLDVYDGATDEGMPNIAIAQEGRSAVYDRFFKKTASGRGAVDECWTYPKYNHVMAESEQQKLRDRNVVWVPNRAWTSYCSIDACEDDFAVPMIGSRNLLRSEEREEQQDYYWLLEKAGMPFPKKIDHYNDIDQLSIVKLHHSQKPLERGFFTCASTEEFHEKAQKLIKAGVIDEPALETARIEEYIIGPVFNFNFFYSPVNKANGEEPLELLGIDWRFESSLDGHVRIPAPQQMTLPDHQMIPEMTVVGHNTATVRESLLGKVFDLGEQWVKAAEDHYNPGIIGPFCLQTCVDKDMNFFIYDVAPRIGGGTNVHVGMGHPYGNALWRTQMSTGRRVAREVKMAGEQGLLREIVT